MLCIRSRRLAATWLSDCRTGTSVFFAFHVRVCAHDASIHKVKPNLWALFLSACDLAFLAAAQGRLPSRTMSSSGHQARLTTG